MILVQKYREGAQSALLPIHSSKPRPPRRRVPNKALSCASKCFQLRATRPLANQGDRRGPPRADWRHHRRPAIRQRARLLPKAPYNNALISARRCRVGQRPVAGRLPQAGKIRAARSSFCAHVGTRVNNAGHRHGGLCFCWIASSTQCVTSSRASLVGGTFR